MDEEKKAGFRPDFRAVSEKWTAKWETGGAFVANEDSKRPKAYVLEMFPYPSAAGLHMGHALNYTIGDIYTRFRRMQGCSVLYPMGYDAFGLPAENAAIKAGEHPAKYTRKSMANFVQQQKALGLSYDWQRMVVTCEPEYYKWNQLFFTKFFENGLVYRKKSAVNWCPECNTVLANEQVHQGKCWRHENTDVEQKHLEQWFIRTTAYADELLEEVRKLDWPERIKTMQENWIGKSEGTEVQFGVELKPANYILLHGFRGSPETNFFPWLKEELEKKGAKVSVPRLPNPAAPSVYEQVKYVLENCEFDENTVLLGHSLGSMIALKVLEKLEKPIRKLVLAAGFIGPKDPGNLREFEKKFDWEFDFEKIKRNAGEIVLLRAENDTLVPESRGRSLYREFAGRARVVNFKASENHICGEQEPVVLNACRDSWPIFTTRVDTIFSVTFIVISAQHPRLHELVTPEQKPHVDAFLKKLRGVSEKDAAELDKEGVFTGTYAINPFNNERIPIWAGNFVIADYGSGMVMADAHDERDVAFARKYNIPLKTVLEPITGTPRPDEEPRTSIVALVENPKTGKVLSLDWGSLGGTLLIGGGLEMNEDPVKCAIREIEEETGYRHLKHIATSEKIHHHYFAASKNVNRNITATGLYFQLAGEEKGETKLEENEKNKFRAEWLSKEDAQKRITDELHKYVLDKFLNQKIYTDYGMLYNSGEFSGLTSEEAIPKMQEWLQQRGLGEKVHNYKFRDWLVSRQRYWGTPIPIIYCGKCGVMPVPEKDLPVLLPEDVKFGQGNPLATSKSFLEAECPGCGGPARRETDTMDTFFDSSWYFLRYADNKNHRHAFDPYKAGYWMPVDMYIGGAEHACMHLIYARFFTKALRDMGMLKVNEPFPRLFNQGMLHGADGNKMSKSLGNVINPMDITDKYSADSLRFFLMSLASPDSDSVWNDNGMESAHKFITRIFRWLMEKRITVSGKRVKNKLNKAIRDVTSDIMSFRHNLALIRIRDAFEYIEKEEISKQDLEAFTKLLHPFCPFMTEEAWARLGHDNFISLADWPVADESLIDGAIDASDELVKGTIADINSVKKLAGLEAIEKITIIMSPEWKYHLYAKLKEELGKTRNPGDILKAIMATDMKKHGGDITKIIPALVKDPSKMPVTVTSQRVETEALLEARELLVETFDANVQILPAEESKEAKARNAAPGKPAIILS